MTKESYYDLCEIVQSLAAGQFSSQEQYAQVIFEIFKTYAEAHLSLDDPN